MRLILIAALLIPQLGAQPTPSAKEDELVYTVIFARHGVRAPTWTPERLNRRC